MCVKSSGRAGRHHGGRVASELFLFFSSIAGTSLVTVSVPPNRCVVQVSCFFLLTFCLQGKAPGAFRLVPGAYSFAWKATIQKSWLRRWFTLCRHVEADKSRSLGRICLSIRVGEPSDAFCGAIRNNFARCRFLPAVRDAIPRTARVQFLTFFGCFERTADIPAHTLCGRPVSFCDFLVDSFQFFHANASIDGFTLFPASGVIIAWSPCRI